MKAGHSGQKRPSGPLRKSGRQGSMKAGRSGLAAVMAKEFHRFFTDRRMVITTLLLPGLMIYALYSLMGSALSSMFSVSDDYRYQVAAVNLPASIEPLVAQAGLEFVAVNADDTDEIARIKERLRDKDYDLLAIFPADFDAKLEVALRGPRAGAPAGAGVAADASEDALAGTGTSAGAGVAAGITADVAAGAGVSEEVTAGAGTTARLGTTAGAGISEDTPAGTSVAAGTAANAPAKSNAPDASPHTSSSKLDVQLFYNSARVESSAAYAQMQGLLDAYKNAAMPLFAINADGAESYNLVTEQDRTGFMLASLLPMLMMIFLFSSAMGVAPESIAGEKERGTIATILVTPLKRWELACGKVASLSCIALLSGASSFIGVMASLPNLLRADSADGPGEELGALAYSASDYIALLLVIITTLLIFVGFISLLSAYARSVKEAATLVMPLMIVVMLVGALAMFSQGAQENLLFYLIPVYNSVQCMVGIFSFTYHLSAVALTLTVNLALSAACVVVLSRMFNSERVVFSK